MRPIRLSMQAFGPYAGEEVVDFRELEGRSFFLIHGPTGSGKTAILDAICFALYGKTSGAERDGSDMRSHYADDSTPTVVIFDFAVGQKKYRVQRSPSYEVAGRKTPIGPDATLWDRTGIDSEDEVSDEGRVLATGVKSVTLEVEEILGFKADQFRQVVLLPQGQFRQALTADSAERRGIMEILFGTEPYRQIEAALKDEARSLQDKLEQAKDRRDTLLKQTDAESVDELKAACEEMCEKCAMAKRTEEEMKEKAGKAAGALEKGRADAGKIEEASAAAAAVAELKKREAEIAAMRDERDAARRALACASAEGLYAAAEETVEAGIKAAEDANRKLAEAKELAEKAREKLEEEKSPKRAEERENAEKVVMRLESLGDKVAAIDEARSAAAEASLAAKSAAGLAEEAGRNKGKLNSKLKEAKSQLKRVQKEAPEALRWETVARETRQTLDRLQRRRELEADLEKANEEALEAADAAENAEKALATEKKDLERLQDSWMAGQAAALAMSLKPGMPCPVCGSLEHPKPACVEMEGPDGVGSAQDAEVAVLSQDAIEAARERVRLAEEDYRRLQRIAADAAQVVAEVKGRLGAWEVGIEPKEGESLSQQVQRIGAELAEAEKRAEEAVAAAKRADSLEQQINDMEEQLVRAEEELAQAEKARSEAEARLAAAKARVEEREADVPVELRAPDALERALAEAETARNRLLEALEEAEKASQAAEQALAAAKSEKGAADRAVEKAVTVKKRRMGEFAARVAEAGFADISAYRASKRSEQQLDALEKAIDGFDQQLHAATVRLARAEEAAAGIESPDLETLEAEAKRLAQASDDAVAARAQLESEADAMQKLVKALEALSQEMAGLEEEYGVVVRIAYVAGGKKPNKLGMNFETFILASMLDKVADAATRRLQVMSKGRYSLRRTLDRKTARSAGGLELEVFDMYTGRERSVTTLSGGEGFMASLSLALGLADVVQAYAGGIHLDTMFIDEGFGALDPESLDLALDTLIDLQRDSGRLVGVISHVPELEERIDARLEVSMTETGSTTRFVVG